MLGEGHEVPHRRQGVGCRLGIVGVAGGDGLFDALRCGVRRAGLFDKCTAGLQLPADSVSVPVPELGQQPEDPMPMGPAE